MCHLYARAGYSAARAPRPEARQPDTSRYGHGWASSAQAARPSRPPKTSGWAQPPADEFDSNLAQTPDAGGQKIRIIKQQRQPLLYASDDTARVWFDGYQVLNILDERIKQCGDKTHQKLLSLRRLLDLKVLEGRGALSRLLGRPAPLMATQPGKSASSPLPQKHSKWK